MFADKQISRHYTYQHANARKSVQTILAAILFLQFSKKIQQPLNTLP